MIERRPIAPFFSAPFVHAAPMCLRAVEHITRKLHALREGRLASLLVLEDAAAARQHEAALHAELTAAFSALRHAQNRVHQRRVPAPGTRLHAALLELTLACLAAFRREPAAAARLFRPAPPTQTTHLRAADWGTSSRAAAAGRCPTTAGRPSPSFLPAATWRCRR